MNPTLRAKSAVAALLVAGLCASASACTNQGSGQGSGSGAAAAGANSAAAQQVVSPSASASGPGCTADTYGAPKLDLADGKTVVGFSQSESTSNPFRAAETASIEAEAKKLGVKLIERNANADVNAQNAQIQDMIAQGAQVLIVAPENSDGLGPALAAAKAKKIPVLTIDRTVTGTACGDFVAFIGSDFYGQAQIAADDLAAATGGQAHVAVLQGTPGNNVSADRTKGFTDRLAAKYPNVQVVASQTANFDQTEGQKVMEQLLQAHPDVNAVYAENDGMALGAIQAMRSAGKTPGKDIRIVSIDGIRQAVQGVVDGQLVADIETNPRFGPLAFQSLKDFYGTAGVQPKVIIKDGHFTKDSAQQALAQGLVY
ncbi:ABC transporter substrate-binding protein [Kitasatospora cineracea]|uniref:Monosaccharide ABC transporter substrate-binding protein (CUT2 family) n=1 Tax=Kitasatospora cineracea TaxID=88074 RepID=A0A3N4RAM8_9ACTN|nr:ABC transporter substrate-binding protein [Kitasatospora cineracea]ROR35589.1 monosaccharide ABC transporter substrate-binding protein (CUT2 family) [Kitasatospora cineracea]RPE27681.1 monosaccharide ABC transporter substrate-binding protein (CUT2 family) [Kitasatospora cineracea]